MTLNIGEEALAAMDDFIAALERSYALAGAARAAWATATGARGGSG